MRSPSLWRLPWLGAQSGCKNLRSLRGICQEGGSFFGGNISSPRCLMQHCHGCSTSLQSAVFAAWFSSVARSARQKQFRSAENAQTNPCTGFGTFRQENLYWVPIANSSLLKKKLQGCVCKGKQQLAWSSAGLNRCNPGDQGACIQSAVCQTRFASLCDRLAEGCVKPAVRQ